MVLHRIRIRSKYWNDCFPSAIHNCRTSSKPHWSGNIRGPLIRLRQFNATAMRRLATQNIS